MKKRNWLNKSKTPTHISWSAMRSRVLHNTDDHHKQYKEKGISICPQWVEDYDKFFEDMGERPFGTTLDRIDNDGDYTPENCRWASPKTQRNNCKNIRLIERDGIVKSISEWAIELELTPKELGRSQARITQCKAKTFDEIFCENLNSYRMSLRVNKCLVCGTDKTREWYRKGKLCSSCYSKAYKHKQS